jgi:formate dehydrogenase major subunit
MQVSRRSFIKGVLIASIIGEADLFGLSMDKAMAESRTLKIEKAKETKSICPFCAVGCSMIAYSTGDGSVNARPSIMHIEGDPDSPINQGRLCAKGSATMQITVNKNRVKAPLYRRKGSKEWEEVSWDFALDRIALLIKEERDKNFITKDSQGYALNQLPTIAAVGGSPCANENNYLFVKAMRSLGLVYIDGQARI